MSAPAITTAISLRNILLPTDFSACSEAALAYGAALARHYDTTFYAVTVVPAEITDYVQPPDPFYHRHCAERKMADLAGRAPLQGIRHREFVKEGTVLEVLLDLIDRLEVGLVVAGSHGRSGVKRIMFGSVAEAIANSAPCPVLTVGPRVAAWGGREQFLKRILYLANPTLCPTKALAYAAWLAESEQGHLTVLHVRKPLGEVRSGQSQLESEMSPQGLAQRLSPHIAASVETEFLVGTGTSREEILKVAEGQRTELIVMGPQHTQFARASTHLLHATFHDVICQAHCPVLTVGE
jgi:nucleotide-binding universal stress UspA family protein